MDIQWLFPFPFTFCTTQLRLLTSKAADVKLSVHGASAALGFLVNGGGDSHE